MDVTKQQLRRDMKARRAAMSQDDVARASDAIRQHLLQHDLIRQAESIFTYVSINNEPDTRTLIHELLSYGKTVCVPRLDDHGRMRAHRIQSLDDLVHNDPTQFNIPVPLPPPPETTAEENPHLALVPGLAFTRTGLRLGLGGGHYDRYLAEHKKTAPVALCYEWQILDDMPNEPHDQSMRFLFVEQQIVDCSALPA